MVDDDAIKAVLTLLAARDPQATICPSEVARAITPGGESGDAAGRWRDAMPKVHAAVDQLLKDGAIGLSWKGEALLARAGPYRIGRGRPTDGHEFD